VAQRAARDGDVRAVASAPITVAREIDLVDDVTDDKFFKMAIPRRRSATTRPIPMPGLLDGRLATSSCARRKQPRL